MPEYKEPEQLQPVDFDQEPYIDPEKSLRDNEALTLVKADFDAYEAFRTVNHDRRWTQNDRLYFGNVPQRNWPGTTTPRSSLPWPITFDHVETAYPAIVQAIFGGAEWFQCIAKGSTTPQQAKEKADELREKLESPKYGYGVSGIRELYRAIRSGLLYGNGGVEIKWDADINDACVEWVDIRDFYFDPNCLTPHVDDCRSVIRRKMFTVAELEDMRGALDLPPIEVLHTLARAPQTASSDQTKRNAELMRGINFTPNTQASPENPAEKKIEGLIYYSRTRCIWLLDRQVVAYNEKNPYRFIPFAFFPCFEVLGRFYAMSVPDRLEELQSYIEALRNLNLDGKNMDLIPPRTMQRNLGTTPSQTRWAPGSVSYSDTPKEAVMEYRPNGVYASVGDEISQLEIEAEKRTGISSLAQGIPRPGNANRTAGGMQMQMQGGSLRLSTIIANIEDYLIVPMLHKLNAILEYHSQEQAPEQAPAAPVTLDALAAGDPNAQAALQNAPKAAPKVQFQILASSRLIQQDKLLQVLPLYFQFVLQGPLVQELARNGKTIDETEFFRFVQDATGTTDMYALIRPMNEQEKAAMQQPDPQTMAKMQQAQMEMQTRKEIMQQKTQADLQKTAMTHEHQANLQDEKTSLGLLELFAQNMAGSQPAPAPGGPPQGAPPQF